MAKETLIRYISYFHYGNFQRNINLDFKKEMFIQKNLSMKSGYKS